MDTRKDLIERVRNGGQYRTIHIGGQVGRDGQVYSDTPPAVGVKAVPYLTAVEVVDKQRYPYRWDEEDLDGAGVGTITYERTPTPEELAEPCCIWFN
jgi:hypothetical protein